MGAPKDAQGFGRLFKVRRMRQAHDLHLRPSRIQQSGDWMEHVPDPKRLTHFQESIDRWVVEADIQIGEAASVHLLGNLLRLSIHPDPQRL